MSNNRDTELVLSLMLVIALLFVVVNMFAGCKSQEPAAPIVQEACKNKTWCKTFDQIIESKITPRMNETDFSAICKSPKANKPTLWKRWFQAVAYAESNFDANETYTESFIDSTTGKRTVSAGLFQLSVSDAKWYKGTDCDAINEKSLFNAEINLKCAIAIYDRRLEKSGNKILSGRDYWAVVRTENKRYPITLNKFKEVGGCE